jgi:hypothetical protein
MESLKITSRTEFIARVAEIQRNLKAPKSQRNTFGKYNYRNCEDILTAANGLLGDLALTLSDDISMIGDRIYVKVTATITDGEHEISNTAFAREALAKKGMDESMITGAASSYARKYALNGLFCIDDTKDSDHDSMRQDRAQQKDQSQVITEIDQSWINAAKKDIKALDQITDPSYKARIQNLIN